MAQESEAIPATESAFNEVSTDVQTLTDINLEQILDAWGDILDQLFDDEKWNEHGAALIPVYHDALTVRVERLIDEKRTQFTQSTIILLLDWLCTYREKAPPQYEKISRTPHVIALMDQYRDEMIKRLKKWALTIVDQQLVFLKSGDCHHNSQNGCFTSAAADLYRIANAQVSLCLVPRARAPYLVPRACAHYSLYLRIIATHRVHP